MMKIIMMLLFLFLIMNLFNKNLIQMIYQNMYFMISFIIIVNYSLNSNNMWKYIYYIIGCDLYSMGLILLSLWIFSLMFMSSGKNFLNLNYLLYLFIMNMMLMLLILCFLMLNLIMFYLFFESSLIPIFLLIIGWGYQIDRIQAGFYMMLYTLFGSLPLFMMIIFIYLMNYSLMLDLIEFKLFNFVFYLMSMIAFFIKMPMYFMHLWLPKAHVEAPLVGSMILAGVMLKLGSYGLLRFMIIMMKMSLCYNKIFIMISMIGGIYSSLICLCQIDMKMLVAYSSVVHMSILMSSMMTLFNWGYYGGFLMMIAHGLCSSGMFYLVNINYNRFWSRSLMINKGMINLFPSLSMMWFLLCSSNLSFPPSLNLFSEVMMLNSLIFWDKNLIFILILLLLFSASYSLYLYSYSQHGNLSSMFFFLKNIMLIEYMILLLHWIPLNLLFMLIYMFM